MIRRIDHIGKFWTKVNKTAKCWLWIGTIDRCGYGMYCVNYRPWKAHRYSWMLANGEIPETLLVLHRCDVPACVNPRHLYLGTVKDNSRDAIERGQQPRGERHGMAKLKENDIKIIRNLYIPRKMTHKLIAEKFGIARTTIKQILSRDLWSHVKA